MSVETHHPWSGSSDPPIVRLIFLLRCTDEERIEYCDEVLRFYRQVEAPVFLLVDCRAVERVTPSQCRILANYEATQEPFAKQWCPGMALAMPDAVVHGILSAIRSLHPMVYPYKSLTDFDKAPRWLMNRAWVPVR